MLKSSDSQKGLENVGAQSREAHPNAVNASSAAPDKRKLGVNKKRRGRIPRGLEPDAKNFNDEIPDPESEVTIPE